MGKLTVRQIEAAKPKDKTYKLTDGEGLQIRITVDGSKIWLVRYMIDGKERQYSLPRRYNNNGGEGYLSLQEARDEAVKIRALARKGIDIQIQVANESISQEIERKKLLNEKKSILSQEEIDRLNLNDLFTKWLENGVRRKDGNSELMRSFQADVLPQFGNTPIKKITEHELRAVLKSMTDRGVNRAAVVMRNNLMQMFKWAEKRQPWRGLLTEGNPMELIEINKIVSPDYDLNNTRDRVLSVEEIQELKVIFARMDSEYQMAPNKRNTERPVEKTVQCAIWIMLSTLCRVGELTMARWEHINFTDKTWFIPKQNVKNNVSDLTIYLSDFSLVHFKRLYEYTGYSDWCFPSTNKTDLHVNTKSIGKQIGDRQAQFKKSLDGSPRKPMKGRKHDNSLVLAKGANGVWTAHDLRRTGATMMQRLGIAIDIIDRCQNHVLAGSKVRRHYLHYDYAVEKKDAWAKLGHQLEELLANVDD